MKFILTADWHIRSTIPSCRKDDFFKVQFEKVKFVLSIAKEYDASIIVAGDIGEKPHWENWLLTKYIELFRLHHLSIYAIPGQHDLVNHRLDKINEGGIGVLRSSSMINLLKERKVKYDSVHLYPYPFGEKVKRCKKIPSVKTIAITHQLICQKPLGWQKDKLMAKSLLRDLECYDLIVSGDNHESFVQEYEGRYLVNPGSLVRTKSDQINFQPKIYLWDSEDNSVKTINVPIEKDVFDLTKTEDEISINNEMQKFVEMLKKPTMSSRCFTSYLREYLEANKIEKKVQEKIWEIVS